MTDSKTPPAAAETEAEAPAPPMAEGTAQEIELYGKATDPRTGRELTEADLPPGRPRKPRRGE